MLFEDALREICKETVLTKAHDGEQLMQMLLEDRDSLPTAIFLDLNMPRKNGFECLEEIRANDKLCKLPVVIFSTTAQQQSIDRAYEQGADYYIQKPGSFEALKEVIKKMLSINWNERSLRPDLEDFLLHSDLKFNAE